EPDAALGGLVLGPRVLISEAALPATRLILPGALVSYDYRLRLSPGLSAGAEPAAWIARAREAFPEAGWGLPSSSGASPSVQRVIDRLALFLNLVGVTALLIGGLGVGNAVSGYVASKRATIATLKSLGARNRTIFAAYLLQILALAGVGIVAGLAAGAL